MKYTTIVLLSMYYRNASLNYLKSLNYA